MKIGPFNIDIGLKKSYRELERFMAMERGGIQADPKIGPRVQLSEYKSWVSSCVGLISKSVAKVHFKYYKSDTDEEIGATYHGLNRFKRLMQKPNAFMSMKFIKAFMQVQWDLCGMCAAYKARNSFGEIVELWPLNMNDYLRTVDQNGIPIEICNKIIPDQVIHIFIIGGKYYTFKLDELLFLSHAHPKYPYMGASPVQQQALVVDVQNYIEIYERDFFKNSARVDMVLSTADELGSTKAQEIKDRWMEKYRGNFHEVAVLDKGLTPVPMKYTNQDFQFLELSRWSRDMVLACYPVNAAKLGITDKVSRSNSVFVDIEYNTYTIQPRLTMWDHELTQMAKEFDPRLEVKHDNPIPRDRVLEVQEARTFIAGASCYSIDEFRKTQNLKNTKDGDVVLIPTKLIPLDMLRDYWKAQIKQLKNPLSGGSPNGQTDPTRHDGDKPHLNPGDQLDPRDTLPTDGRIIEDFEKKLIEIWYSKIKIELESYKKEEFIKFITLMCNSTVKSLFLLNKEIDLIEDDNWIDRFGFKLGNEFCNTFINMKEYQQELYSNSRISKLIYTGVNTSLNYSKYLISKKYGLKKRWEIDRNLCGHYNRIKEMETFDKFVLGEKELNFPNEDYAQLNLNCCCKLKLINEKR